MAASNPAALAAIIPMAAGAAVGNVPGNSTQGAMYRGGVPMLGLWAQWYGNAAPTERLVLPPNSTEAERVRLRNSYSLSPKKAIQTSSSGTSDTGQMMHLPTRDILRQARGALTPYDRYITWTPADQRWKEVEFIGAGAHPRVPALHVGTWQDYVTIGETTRLFKYLQDLGTPNQYLIIGAGSHCSIQALSSELGRDLSLGDLDRLAKELPDLKVADFVAYRMDFADLKFGDLEVGDARYGGVDHGYAKLFRKWLDYWLQGKESRVLEMPKVQLYVQGRGWVSGERWPLPETKFTKYFLGSNFTSLRAPSTGTLSVSLPKHDMLDSYLYDPALPTPSLSDLEIPFVALDQRPSEARKDVLTYTSSLLEQPVTIAGPVEVVLYVSSSAKDTDFFVKLVDVYPNGKAIELSEDAFRVRYREGFDRKVLMQPGKVYQIRLANMVAGVRFQKGHRIRLDISSSSFPLYERNLNTGGNNYDETSWVIAENSIHSGRRYPSYVVLPVQPD